MSRYNSKKNPVFIIAAIIISAFVNNLIRHPHYFENKESKINRIEAKFENDNSVLAQFLKSLKENSPEFYYEIMNSSIEGKTFDKLLKETDFDRLSILIKEKYTKDFNNAPDYEFSRAIQARADFYQSLYNKDPKTCGDLLHGHLEVITYFYSNTEIKQKSDTMSLTFLEAIAAYKKDPIRRNEILTEEIKNEFVSGIMARGISEELFDELMQKKDISSLSPDNSCKMQVAVQNTLANLPPFKSRLLNKFIAGEI